MRKDSNMNIEDFMQFAYNLRIISSEKKDISCRETDTIGTMFILNTSDGQFEIKTLLNGTFNNEIIVSHKMQKISHLRGLDLYDYKKCVQFLSSILEVKDKNKKEINMEEKLFMRKKDGKVFSLLYMKHFMLNNEIKETGTKLVIPFDIYLMKADDGEVEAEMYPMVYDRFSEVGK